MQTTQQVPNSVSVGHEGQQHCCGSVVKEKFVPSQRKSKNERKLRALSWSRLPYNGRISCICLETINIATLQHGPGFPEFSHSLIQFWHSCLPLGHFSHITAQECCATSCLSGCPCRTWCRTMTGEAKHKEIQRRHLRRPRLLSY